MITKERLEELIEQDKVFYWVFNKEIRMLCNLSVPTYWKANWELYGKDCFETREEAEWHKEFGCITRTQRLVLPTWEETIDLIYSGSFGVQTIIKFDKCKFGYKLQLDGNVYIFVDKETDTLFMGSLTKENYTLACRKAKELFLGEKI